MSLVTTLMCDTCGKTAPTVTLPDDWYALAHGGEHWHFHDEACLAIWRLTMLSVMPAQQEPQDKPDCKARRFLLIDEAANIVEGVKWEGGRVTLDPERDSTGMRYYSSWDQLKENHPGSGVQWIDQEVAE